MPEELTVEEKAERYDRIATLVRRIKGIEDIIPGSELAPSNLADAFRQIELIVDGQPTTYPKSYFHD